MMKAGEKFADRCDRWFPTRFGRLDWAAMYGPGRGRDGAGPMEHLAMFRVGLSRMRCSNRRPTDTRHEANCRHLIELNAHGKVLLAFRIEHKALPNVASAESLFLPSSNERHA